MRLSKVLPILSVFMLASCGTETSTQPGVDDLAVVAHNKARSLKSDKSNKSGKSAKSDKSGKSGKGDSCRVRTLKPTQKGTIKETDCLFGVDQREDLYRVDQARLGQSDLSGATMLTFAPDAEFDGIYGVSNWDETMFGDPVFAFRKFVQGDMRRFSLIGSSPEYKLFFSGQDGTQLGKYTLTTTVEPSAGTCDAGQRVYIEGTITFSSAISDTNACNFMITVGPNTGPIKAQFWFAKLKAGQSVTIDLDGVDGSDDTITLAAIVFNTNFALLDFSDAPGDTDRSLSFTAPFQAYYYIEISGRPGVDSPYDFTFTTH